MDAKNEKIIEGIVDSPEVVRSDVSEDGSVRYIIEKGDACLGVLASDGKAQKVILCRGSEKTQLENARASEVWLKLSSVIENYWSNLEARKRDVASDKVREICRHAEEMKMGEMEGFLESPLGRVNFLVEGKNCEGKNVVGKVIFSDAGELYEFYRESDPENLRKDVVDGINRRVKIESKKEEISGRRRHPTRGRRGKTRGIGPGYGNGNWS